MKAKRIFSIIAAAALAITASAQQSEHDNYIGVAFGGGLNTMLYQPANGQQKVGAGFDAGLHYSHFFNHLVGLRVGLQYSWCNAYATYNWNEVTTGLTHASNPGITYNLTTGFNNFTEQQNMGILSVPVEVLFRKALNDRWAFIGGVGLQLDAPLHGKYIARGGSYSTTGVFPALGSYTVSDMPEHGFSTYTTTQGAKINNRAKIGGSVIADLGFRVAMNNNWGFYMGVYAGYGFTNLEATAKTDEMIMINAVNPAVINYRGTFDSNQTAKANLLRCGVKFAFDFGWPAANDDKALEAERLAREAFVADSIAAAEQARLAAQKAEQERLAKEAAERARIAREKAIADSIAAAEAAEKARIEAIKRNAEAIDVHFNSEGRKFEFKEGEQAIIDELCQLMKEDKSIRIMITGHTDNYGDPRQNLEFYGMKRAEALRDYMVSQGVDAAQIQCESKGQTEPKVPNDTRANRALNRRAHITVL